MRAALMAAACWPVWIWYVRATLDDSNDGAGLLAAATALAMLLRRSGPALAQPLLLPAMLMLAYGGATLAGIAPAPRAALVALALAALGSAHLGRRFDAALAALCLLALPLAASLQFYCGYPLRVLAGALAAGALRMQGLAVSREGAMLAWDGQLIAIDAPCSGVRMLWAGLYLASALACANGLNARRTAACLGGALLLVLLANALRAAALFYMETGLVHLPPAAHGGIGVVAFVAAALSIAWYSYWLRERAQ